MVKAAVVSLLLVVAPAFPAAANSSAEPNRPFEAMGSPGVSQAEAARFVAEHPQMFDRRKVFVVEQIQSQPVAMADASEMVPLKTLEQVERFLDSKGLHHLRTFAVIDALRTDARLIEAIEKLPKDEVFVIPAQGALTINKVREEYSMPFVGPAAVELARRSLMGQANQVSSPQATATPPAGQLYVFLYSKGPSWRAGKPSAQQELSSHEAYLKDLQDTGRLVAAGSFMGGDGEMAIVRARDQTQAKAMLSTDPAIAAGVFQGRLEEWSPRLDPLTMRGP